MLKAKYYIVCIIEKYKHRLLWFASHTTCKHLCLYLKE